MSKVTRYACDSCKREFPDPRSLTIIDVTQSRIPGLAIGTFHFCCLGCLREWCSRLTTTPLT